MGDTAPTPMLDIGPRIGCDVVNVVDVTRSIELFGRRYLDRTFTPHELQTCAGPARDQRLAAGEIFHAAGARIVSGQNCY